MYNLKSLSDCVCVRGDPLLYPCVPVPRARADTTFKEYIGPSSNLRVGFGKCLQINL